jgi:hypothetical protein
MESWLVILLVALAFLVLFWKPKSGYDTAADQKQGIPPDIIQVIIEGIQKEHPDEVPLETLFINRVGEDRYSARFMFMNTQGFYGTQYDVQAQVSNEGSVHITSMSASAQVEQYDSGFTPYRPDQYTDYVDIKKTMDDKLKSELVNYRQTMEKTQADVNKIFSNDAMMAKYMPTAQTNSYAPEPTTAPVVGLSPARSGNIVGAGATIADQFQGPPPQPQPAKLARGPASLAGQFMGPSAAAGAPIFNSA